MCVVFTRPVALRRIVAATESEIVTFDILNVCSAQEKREKKSDGPAKRDNAKSHERNQRPIYKTSRLLFEAAIIFEIIQSSIMTTSTMSR
jgi:hypothetical protein